tara:strand:- start:288 stop:434 length:147 start_codon:yes stop_codon:yes gene_type:complete
MKIKYFAWIKDITKKDYELIEKDFPKNIEELKKKIKYNVSRFRKTYNE